MTPDEVMGRNELVAFLEEMRLRLEDGALAVTNETLSQFLSGAAGWVDDLDGYFSNRGERVPDQPTWSLVAAIFAAAAVYE